MEKCVVDLVNSWKDTENVPKILFDLEWWQKATAEEREKELNEPSETVRLINVIGGAIKNFFIQLQPGKPAKEIDVWAAGKWTDIEIEIGDYGDEIECEKRTPVLWVIDIRYRERPVNDRHVQEFEKKFEAAKRDYIREVEELSYDYPLVHLGWFISKSGFTPGALKLIKELGMHTSNLEQLNLLFRILGLEELKKELL